jgi:long-chain acyl-CoA synthetase
MSQVLRAISRHAAADPGKPALIGIDAVFSYSELLQLISDVAERLEQALPCPGPIAIRIENDPAWVITDLACVFLQRPVIPLPPFFTDEQSKHAMLNAGAIGILEDNVQAGFSGTDTLTVGMKQLTFSPTHSLPAKLPPHTAKITYTSGTTSDPKGVCLSQEGLEAVSQSLVDAIGSAYAKTHVSVMPLAVLLENVAGVYATLLAGGACVLLPQSRIGFASAFQPDFLQLVACLTERSATSIILVPELLRGLMHTLALTGKRLPMLGLVAVGGSRLAPRILEGAQALGLPVHEGYGLSEAASVVAFNTPHSSRPGTVGKVLPHVNIRVDAHGEIIILDPAMLGYVGQSDRQGEFPTGDTGALDDDGFLRIDGRTKNTLITSYGRNVAPEWIESELLAQPEIGQAMAYGDGEPTLSALIVPSAQGIPTTSLASAIERANLSLPEYARVKAWRAVPPFTIANKMLTGTGRVRRDIILKDHVQCQTI